MYISEGFDDYLSKPINAKLLEKYMIKYIPDEKIVLLEEDAAIDTGLSASDDEQKNPGESANVDETAKKDEPEKNENGVTADKLIDRDTGIELCGGIDALYTRVLKIFVGEHEAKKDIVKNSYDEKDWKRFVVEVHSLKSSAANIGAAQLSQMAKDMEEAGKKLLNGEAEETVVFIKDNLPALFSMYERVVKEAEESI